MRFFRPGLLLLGVLAVAGCSNPRFEPHTDADGKFTANFPGKVKTETRSQPSEVGMLTLKMIGAETRWPNVAYMVGYFDIPRGAFYDFDKATEGVKKNNQATVTESRDFKAWGVSGREVQFAIEKPKKGNICLRMFIHDNRMYQVMVVGANVTLSSSQVQEFFNSFKLNSTQATPTR